MTLAIEQPRNDPTKTTTTIRELSRWIRGRIGELDSSIRQKLIEQDALGIDNEFAGQWANLSDSEKVQVFDEWFESRVQSLILNDEFDRKAERHLTHATKRGTDDAHRELRQAGVDLGDSEETLRQDVVQAGIAMGVVSLRDEIRSELASFRSEASTILSRGLQEGKSRSDLVKQLVERGEVHKSKVTADVSSEVVNQYNRTGQLSAYNRIDPELEPVLSVDVEFVTAGDSKVCEQCKSLASRNWTLEEAQNFNIPYDTHPHCRCRWVVTDVVEAS